MYGLEVHFSHSNRTSPLPRVCNYCPNIKRFLFDFGEFSGAAVTSPCTQRRRSTSTRWTWSWRSAACCPPPSCRCCPWAPARSNKAWPAVRAIALALPGTRPSNPAGARHSKCLQSMHPRVAVKWVVLVVQGCPEGSGLPFLPEDHPVPKGW